MWEPAPLAAAVGCLMVMVMLCLGGCGFGSQTAYTVRRLRLREELVDLWWAAYHAAMLLVLWALVATAALLGMQLKLQGLEPNWGVGPQSLMLLVYSDSFLHHLVPLADAAVWVTDLALLMANALAAALFIRSQRPGTAEPVATADGGCHDVYLHGGCRRQCVDGDAADGAGPYGLDAGTAVDRR